jgi:hypothetical protein
MDAGMGLVPLMIQKTAERVFHRPGRRGVDVAFDRRQVDDIPADEKIRDPELVAVNVVQGAHPGAGLEGHPGHILVLEIETDVDVVGFENRLVAVQIFALEGVGDFGFILDADQVGEAVPPKSEDRAFELPGSGVGRRKREMPADVVLEDGRGARFQAFRPVRQLKQPDDIVENRFGVRPDDRHLSLGHDSTSSVGSSEKNYSMNAASPPPGFGACADSPARSATGRMVFRSGFRYNHIFPPGSGRKDNGDAP